ncbi:MAG: hypothetical protein K8T91_16055 [Planctomycetes bacterium]|nr:hypothetical protein [Planctomycetota bacterium]
MSRKHHTQRAGKRMPPAAARHSASLKGSQRQRTVPGKRARGGQPNLELPYSPPEDWHEPKDKPTRRDPYGFRIAVQPPGEGYQHVLTPAEIRSRLRLLPPHYVAPLEVVQLSRMTRKKERFPCYGMQWGSTLYLYPIETTLIESHCRPPKPNQVTEAAMYGGNWVEGANGRWTLHWTDAALKDFYLNNILMHELGHLLDERNTGYRDRERYAEWFALHYGYKQSLRLEPSVRERVQRRLHG